MCFPVSPKRKATHKQIWPPPIPGTIPKSCLCLLVFCPPKVRIQDVHGKNLSHKVFFFFYICLLNSSWFLSIRIQRRWVTTTPSLVSLLNWSFGMSIIIKIITSSSSETSVWQWEWSSSGSLGFWHSGALSSTSRKVGKAFLGPSCHDVGWI